MNVEMTKAILDGRKTQTRRVIKQDIVSVCPSEDTYTISIVCDDGLRDYIEYHRTDFIKKFAKYQKDEVIWVREPAKVMSYNEENLKVTIAYKADLKYKTIDVPDRFTDKYNWISAKWIKSYGGIPNGCIKEMARIFLKITNVRVERLKDISYGSIISEGCHLELSDIVTYDDVLQENSVSYSAYCWYRDLWNKTAPKGYKWEDNPYVFVYEFKIVNRDGSDYA